MVDLNMQARIRAAQEAARKKRESESGTSVQKDDSVKVSPDVPVKSATATAGVSGSVVDNKTVESSASNDEALTATPQKELDASTETKPSDEVRAVNDGGVDWEAKFKELEASTQRRLDSMTKQMDSLKQSSAKRALEAQSANEQLSKELKHWKEQATGKNVQEFDNRETFNHRFAFYGQNITFGKGWVEPFAGTTSRISVEVPTDISMMAFDAMDRMLKGRRVKVGDKGQYQLQVDSSNSILTGVNGEPNKRGRYFFMSMLLSFCHDPKKMVQFAWNWVCAQHTTLVATPSDIKKLVQGARGENGSKAFDFYVIALAYYDWTEEQKTVHVSEDEAMAVLYDLRERLSKNAELSSSIYEGVVTEGLLSSALFAREMGIHTHAIRPGLLPKDTREYLASRVPDTEVEIAKTVLKEARSYANEVMRREAKASK